MAVSVTRLVDRPGAAGPGEDTAPADALGAIASGTSAGNSTGGDIQTRGPDAHPGRDGAPGRDRIYMRRPFEVELPRHLSCAAIGRRLVERLFFDQLDRDGMADLKLVTTELVEDTCRRAEGDIRLRLQHRGDRIRVEVLAARQAAAAAGVWAELPVLP